jgi:hypothetical protein
VIRRCLWLVLGAVLGVTGYRRATRLARAMVPGHGPLRHGPLRRAGLGTLRTLSGRERAGGAAGFMQDVREGRAEYLDRHPLHRGRTLEGQRIREQHPHETGRTRGNSGIDYAKDGR